jgi:hypothetical protein
MNWDFSPLEISIIAVLIVAITSLIYWKRKPIKKWLAGRKVSVKMKAGPLEVSLNDREKPKGPDGAPAGVDFGEGSDFRGTTIGGVAGRDIRRGSAAVESPGGQASGVAFGEERRFRDAEIEDIAGRDIVEGDREGDIIEIVIGEDARSIAAGKDIQQVVKADDHSRIEKFTVTIGDARGVVIGDHSSVCQSFLVRNQM